MKNITGSKILSVIDGMKVNESDRELFSVMLHEVVFDNQRAIFDLVQLGHIRSATALLRVLFEAHVKALWMYSAASDKQISEFKKDNIKSTKRPGNKIWFSEIISELEDKNPNLNGKISEFKRNHWNGLNSLTHSGILQLTNSSGLIISRNRDDASYAQTILEFSERFAICSLGEVGKIVSSKDIIKCAIELADQRRSTAI